MDQPDTSLSPASKLSSVLDEDVLAHFVGRRSIPFYQARFGRLIEASGLTDTPVSEISTWALFGISTMSVRARIPWTDNGLFNWAAFIGGLGWIAWRRILGWGWLVPLFGLLIALALAAEEWLGLNNSALRFGWILSIVLALFGTDLLLVTIVHEIKRGSVRAKPLAPWRFGIAVLATLGPVFAVAIIAEEISHAHALECTSAEKAPQEEVIRSCTYLIARPTTKPPVLTKAYFIRGVVHWRRGETQPAIDDYTQSLQLNPRQVEALYDRGLALRRIGQVDRAIEDFNAVLRINPNDLNAHVMRGSAYGVKGDLRHALEDAEAGIRINPKFAAGYNSIGVLHLRQRQPEVAIEHFDRAIQLNGIFSEAYHNRGYAYRTLGKFDQAIRDYDQALLIGPKTAQLFFNRGAAHTILGGFDQAKNDFEAALQLDPKHASALFGRGFAKTKLEDQQGGKADMAAATQIKATVAADFSVATGH